MQYATLVREIDSSGLKPVAAITLFRDSQSTYAIRHPLSVQGEQYQIGPGRYVDQSAALELSDILRGVRSGVDEALWLPSNALAVTNRGSAWYCPARTGTMWFRTGSKTQAFQVPWPAMIFVAGGTGLHVCAIAGRRKPGKSTPVYHAPLMNVYSNGELCIGSGVRPSGTGSGTWSQWQALIYDTAFSHVNHPSTLLLPGKRSPKKISNEAHLRFWRGLDGKNTFPTESLVEIGTAAQFIERALK